MENLTRNRLKSFGLRTSNSKNCCVVANMNLKRLALVVVYSKIVICPAKLMICGQILSKPGKENDMDNHLEIALLKKNIRRLLEENKALERAGNERIKQLQAELSESVTENPHVQKLILHVVQLQAEAKKLKEFARYIIERECWSIYDLDGGDIQDLAEKLGLIEPHIATEEDLAASATPIVDESTDYEVGDTIYRFTETLKG